MSFFEADRHGSTETHEQCPRCDTWGISGQPCPHPLCDYVHSVNVAQVAVDPLLDAAGVARREAKNVGRSGGQLLGAFGRYGRSFLPDASSLQREDGDGGDGGLPGFDDAPLTAFVAFLVGFVSGPLFATLFCETILTTGLWGMAVSLALMFAGSFIGGKLAGFTRRRGWTQLPVLVVFLGLGYLSIRLWGGFGEWWRATPFLSK